MLLPNNSTFFLAFLDNRHAVDGLVVLIIGLLIFGNRLAEFGKIIPKAAIDLDYRNLTLCLAIVLWLIFVFYCAFYRFASLY